MLKDSTAVIGLGLGGMTVTYEFQERNYLTYSVNGSEQDIKSIPNAKNSMRLEGYDGLAGNRELAYEALKRNKHILKKLKEIEKKINIVIASGGGSSGSGCITFVSEILVQNPDKIVVPVILMPRQDESIQKRLNAYNVAKELMQIEELGAIIFVNNEAYSDLKKINTILVNMLDAFLSDTSYSSGSNFDDSEKMKMLKDSIISQYGDDFSSKLTGVNSAIENVYNRQKDMIDAINAMAEKWITKADQMLQQPTKTEGVLEEVEQKPDKDNVAEGNPTPDPPKVSDDESIRDAVLVDPDEPKKKPNKDKTGNNKAEVGDKVTFSSGRYYEASDGSGASGNMYLGKKVKITRINKGSKYPYAIDATDGTELGWVKLNQLKGYASGIMRVPNDQLAWTQEQGEEAIVRNDGSILTPLSRDVSVLNADMTKNLWDFMGNPGSFLSDYSDGEKFGVKNIDNSSSVDVGGVTIQCTLPNVIDSKAFVRELVTNKDAERAIKAMTIDRIRGGSSLAKYKYKH